MLSYTRAWFIHGANMEFNGVGMESKNTCTCTIWCSGDARTHMRTHMRAHACLDVQAPRLHHN